MTRRMTARAAAMAGLAAAALVTAGCLVKETKETLCLEPDGSVRWAVLERNVHATGDTPADRQRQEDEFMANVRAGQHPNAVAFRLLGGQDVRTEIVSAEWPFAVLTEARLPDIARVWQQILDKAGEVRAQSVLERDGARTTWRITVDYDPDFEAPDSGAPSEINTSLLDDPSPVVVIRHGQFVDAVGFDITDDGRVATLHNLEEHDWGKEPHLALSLTWVAAEAVNGPKK